MLNIFRTCLICLLLCQQVTAKTTEKPIERIQVISSKSSASIMQLADYQQIGSQSLELLQAQHLNQVLSRTAGTWLSRGNGQESLLAMRSPVFTGAGACGEFLTLEDGIPLRASGFCNVNQLFDSAFELASKIEVVNGANSARYGSNAIHGMINVVTPKPFEQANQVKFGLGANQLTKLQIKHNQESNIGDFLLVGDWVDTNGFQDNSGYQQYKLLAKHSSQVGNWQFDTSLSVQDLDQITAGYIQAGDKAYLNRELSKQNALDNAYRKAQSQRLTVHAKTQLADGSLVKISPYLRNNKMDFLMHYLPGTPIENNQHISLGVIGHWLINLDNHHIEFSSQLENTQGEVKQYQPWPTDSGSAFLDSILPQGQQYDFAVEMQTLSVAADWSWVWSDDFYWQNAIRFEQINYQYTNYLDDGNNQDNGEPCGMAPCRYYRPASRDDSFADVSFSLMPFWQLNAQTSAHIKFDKAYRAPHIMELYRVQNAAQQAVDAETAYNTQLGIEYLNDKLKLTAVVFNMHKHNVIAQNSQRLYVNDERTQHSGLEANFAYQLSANWQYSLQAIWARHKYKKQFAGNDIDTAPRLIASQQLAYTWADRIKLEFESVYMSDYYTDAENQHSYAGHLLHNIRASFAVSDSWRLAVQWLNITDKAYAERADFAFGNDRYFVGQPSRVFAQVSYQY